MKSYLTRVRDKKIRNGYITWETKVVILNIHCLPPFHFLSTQPRQYPMHRPVSNGLLVKPHLEKNTLENGFCGIC